MRDLPFKEKNLKFMEFELKDYFGAITFEMHLCREFMRNACCEDCTTVVHQAFTNSVSILYGHCFQPQLLHFQCNSLLMHIGNQKTAQGLISLHPREEQNLFLATGFSLAQPPAIAAIWGLNQYIQVLCNFASHSGTGKLTITKTH